MSRKPESAQEQQKNSKRVPGRPFKKGQSGNPGGRPAGTVSLLTELRRQLSLGATAEDVVRDTIEQARNGNGVALKLVWDRIEGPVKESLDVTTGGQPFKALIGVDIDEI